METERRIEKHKKQSNHYFENALKSIEAGEAEKAGEFLWGSMAQAIKAVAISRGKELKRHRDIVDYARELSNQLKDDSIWDVFGSARYLHGNFYEAGLPLDEVYIYATRIKAVVGKLLGLIPNGKEAE